MTEIEGHYNAKKNVTKVKSLLKENGDESGDEEKELIKETLPGLVLLNITTDKGVPMTHY